MAKRSFWACLAFFVLVLSIFVGQLPSQAAVPRHYTELSFPPTPEIRLPEFSRYQLANGLVVYLIEDHELPFISGTAWIRAGSRWEPKVGLADLTGDLLRTGGTKLHTSDQLNQLLEQEAASVETSISDSAGFASFNTLTEDLPKVFGLFAEVLTQPAFAVDKLNFAKSQARNAIARRNDDPGQILSREFNRLVYGTNHPYARLLEYRDLDQIDRRDLVDFYTQYFHPNNMILGIVGDFDPGRIKALIQEQLGAWPANPQLTLPSLPEVKAAQTGGIFLIEQPQLNQSYVRLGHLGGILNSPDFAALAVINNVLNGFGGRLFNEVRSRQGLAYDVYGVWSPRFDYPGLFFAGGQTRSETTIPFIRAVLNEIDRLRKTPITASELTRAKESTLNSFIFNFQTPSQNLSRLLRYEYYNYPRDFIFQYQRQVASTSVADIQKAAQTYLKPEQIVTLVVGNQAAIQPPLTTLSPEVKAIDITIPSP